MIGATTPLHQAFCRSQGLEHRAEEGVLRGFHPWQASFNRIEILGSLLDARFRGWFVYLDADAVIVQPDFDIRAYLKGKADRALVIAPGGEQAWNVNSGVFFLNLGHDCGRKIAALWRRSVHEVVSEAMLMDSSIPWRLPDGRCFPDDQHLLQMVLCRNPPLIDATCVERSDFMNYSDGSFIRQIIRAGRTPDQRLDEVRELAEQAWRGWSGPSRDRGMATGKPDLRGSRAGSLLHRLKRVLGGA